ncbi:MAG TPA: thioesterase domain-containing protein [Clostridia bacterium]
MERTKIFFLPYAGGSSTSYLSWKKFLSPELEFVPIELSGRGKRFVEPLYNSILEAIDDIYKIISNDINTPYAIYGHSMGTILAYELVRKIRDFGRNEPLHIFFSGRYPPFVDANEEPLSNLPEDIFLEKVFEYGGMSREMLESKELIDIFLPILKADHRIIEEYDKNREILKLNCDITVLNGKEDTFVEADNLKRWTECTNKKCTLLEFEGDHFFINNHKEKIVDIINSTLRNNI